jgi:hypothetical protein
MYDSELIKICEAYNSIINRKNDTINKEKFDDEMDSINPAAIKHDEDELNKIDADKEFDKKQYEVLKAVIDKYNLKFNGEDDIVCITPFRPMSLDKFCDTAGITSTYEAHDVILASIPTVGTTAEYMLSHQFYEFVKDINRGWDERGAVYNNTIRLMLECNTARGIITVVEDAGQYGGYTAVFRDNAREKVINDIIRAYPFLASFINNNSDGIEFILPTQINERIKSRLRKANDTGKWYDDAERRENMANAKKRSEENMMWKQHDIEQGIERDSDEPKNIRPPKIIVR